MAQHTCYVPHADLVCCIMETLVVHALKTFLSDYVYGLERFNWKFFDGELSIGPLRLKNNFFNKQGIPNYIYGAKVDRLHVKLPIPWMSPEINITLDGLAADVGGAPWSKDNGTAPKEDRAGELKFAAQTRTDQSDNTNTKPPIITRKATKKGWGNSLKRSVVKSIIANFNVVIRNTRLRYVDVTPNRIDGVLSSNALLLELGEIRVGALGGNEILVKLAKLAVGIQDLSDGTFRPKILDGVDLEAIIRTEFDGEEQSFLPSSFSVELLSKDEIRLFLSKKDQEFLQAMNLEILTRPSHLPPADGKVSTDAEGRVSSPQVAVEADEKPGEMKISISMEELKINADLEYVRCNVGIKKVLCNPVSDDLLAISEVSVSAELGNVETRENVYSLQILETKVYKHGEERGTIIEVQRLILLEQAMSSTKVEDASACALKKLAEISRTRVELPQRQEIAGENSGYYDFSPGIFSLPVESTENSCPYHRCGKTQVTGSVIIDSITVGLDMTPSSVEKLCTAIYRVQADSSQSGHDNIVMSKTLPDPVIVKTLAHNCAVSLWTISITNKVDLKIPKEDGGYDLDLCIEGIFVEIDISGLVFDLNLCFRKLHLNSHREIIAIESNEANDLHNCVHVQTGPQIVCAVDSNVNVEGVAIGSYTGINVYVQNVSVPFESSSVNEFICFLIKKIIRPLSGPVSSSAETVTEPKAARTGYDMTVGFSLSITTSNLDAHLLMKNDKSIALVQAKKSLTCIVFRENGASEYSGLAYELKLIDTTEQGKYHRNAIVPLDYGDQNAPVAWSIDCSATGEGEDVYSPVIKIRGDRLHVSYLNRITLEITQYVIDLLLPAVTTFDLRTQEEIALEEMVDVYIEPEDIDENEFGDCVGVKELSEGDDNDDDDEDDESFVNCRGSFVYFEENKDSKFTESGKSLTWWTQLEVILVNSICDLVQSSGEASSNLYSLDKGEGALRIHFEYLDLWHDSACGGCCTKSNFFENGILGFSVLDHHRLPQISRPPPSTSSQSQTIDSSLLAKNREDGRDGLRISIVGAEITTLNDENICAKDIHLHATIHLPDTLDVENNTVIVDVQTEKLPLSLTRRQYREVLAMIYGNFGESIETCYPIIPIPTCGQCGGLHFPEDYVYPQKCKTTWCYVNVHAIEASLAVIESGKRSEETKRQAGYEYSNPVLEGSETMDIAFLSFKDLSYIITMKTDDSMVQEVSAARLHVSNSNEILLSQKKFKPVLLPLDSINCDKQLAYEQLSTWTTLHCNVVLNQTQLFGQGRTFAELTAFFVEPIYTYDADPKFDMSKYGLSVNVTATECVISLLDNLYASNSKCMNIWLDAQYIHKWCQDIENGPGKCDLWVDLVLKGLSLMHIDDQPSLHDQILSLFQPLKVQLEQSFVVQKARHDSDEPQNKKVVSRTTLVVSALPEVNDQLVTGTRFVRADIASDVCFQIPITDIFEIQNIVQELQKDILSTQPEEQKVNPDDDDDEIIEETQEGAIPLTDILEQSQLVIEPIQLDILVHRNVSLFRVRMDKISALNWKENKNFEGLIEFSIEANYFNDRIMQWEPVLEPTEFKIDTLHKAEKQDVEVKIVNNEDVPAELNLNISSNLLQYLVSTDIFANSQSQVSDTTEMVCFLKNESGREVVVRSPEKNIKLKNGGMIDLEISRDGSDARQRRLSTRGIRSLQLVFVDDHFQTDQFDISAIGKSCLELRRIEDEDSRRVSKPKLIEKLEGFKLSEPRRTQNILIEVLSLPDGRKCATISSTFSITNNCASGIQLKLVPKEKSTDTSTLSVADREIELKPREQFRFPIGLYRVKWKVMTRPSDEFKWAEVLIDESRTQTKQNNDKKYGECKREKGGAVTSNSRQNSWHFQYQVISTPLSKQERQSQHRKKTKHMATLRDVTIKPAMELKNLLPQALSYKLIDGNGLLAYGVLPEGKSIQLHNNLQGVYIQFMLANYQWSEEKELKLQGIFKSEANSLSFVLNGINFAGVDGDNSFSPPPLVLKCALSADNAVAVFCPFWIENCSGTDINVLPIYNKSFTKKLSSSLSFKKKDKSKDFLSFNLKSKDIIAASPTKLSDAPGKDSEEAVNTIEATVTVTVYLPTNLLESVTVEIHPKKTLLDLMNEVKQKCKLDDIDANNFFIDVDSKMKPMKLESEKCVETLKEHGNKVYMRHTLDECCFSQRNVNSITGKVSNTAFENWGNFLLIGQKQVRIKCRNSTWSEIIELSTTLSNYVDIRVPDEAKSYQISLRSHPLQGIFARSTGIKISSRFVLINTLKEKIYLRQGSISDFRTSGMEFEDSLEPDGSSNPYHWPDSNAEKTMCIRFEKEGSLWSGFFPLDVVEDFDLSVKKMNDQNRLQNYIVRINIRQQGAKVVITFTPEDLKYAPYLIQNELEDCTVRFRQDIEGQKEWIEAGAGKPPKEFAWDMPFLPNRALHVQFSVKCGQATYQDGKELYDHFQVSKTIMLDTVSNKSKRLEDGYEFVIEVKGVSKVLKIRRETTVRRDAMHLLNAVRKKIVSKRRMHKREKSTDAPLSPSTKRRLKRQSIVMAVESFSPNTPSESLVAQSRHVELPLVGISLIDDYCPQNRSSEFKRQELLYISLHAIHIYERTEGNNKQTGISVGLMQVDNQMEKASYPTLLCQKQFVSLIKPPGSPKKLEKTAKAAAIDSEIDYFCEHCQAYFPWKYVKKVKQNPCEIPALHVCFAKDTSHTEIDYFEHINFSLAPIEFTVDEKLAKSIVNMVYSVKDDSSGSQANSAIGTLVDEEQANALSSTLSEHSEKQTLAKKIYCHVAYINNVCVRLSFGGEKKRLSFDEKMPQESLYDDTVSVASTRSSWTKRFLDFLLGLTHFEAALVLLDGIQHNHYCGEMTDLTSKILQHYIDHGKTQVRKILGASSALEAPARVFGGVKDLIVKPAAGLRSGGMKGFTNGAKMGAQTLASSLTSVTFGVVGGGAKLLNMGAAQLTFDEEYQRAAKGVRDIDRVDHGFTWNVKAGGHAVFMGFVDGLSGVVMDPMRGAQTGGAKGFVKGLGKGVIGLPMKPIAGIFHGVAKTSQGIKAWSDRHSGHDHNLLVNARKTKQKYLMDRIRLPRAFPKIRDSPYKPYNILDAMGFFMLKKVSSGSYSNEDMVQNLMIREEGEGGARWLIVTEKRILMIHAVDGARLKNAVVSWMLPLTMVESIEVRPHRKKMNKCELLIRSATITAGKQGPLLKRGGKISTLKERWFTLSKLELSYDEVITQNIVGWKVNGHLGDGQISIEETELDRRHGVSVKEMVISVTTAAIHKLSPGDLVFVGGLVERKNNGIKKVEKIIDSKTFTFLGTFGVERSARDFSNAQVTSAVKPKNSKSSSPKKAVSLKSKAVIPLDTQTLSCARQPHDFDSPHGIMISSSVSKDGKQSLIQSKKTNAFGKIATGNHKNMLVMADSEYTADLWCTYLTHFFDQQYSDSIGGENDVFVPTPGGLAEKVARKFCTVVQGLIESE